MQKVHTPKINVYQDAILEILEKARAKGHPNMSLEDIEMVLRNQKSQTYKMNTRQYALLAIASLTHTGDVFWDEDNICLTLPG